MAKSSPHKGSSKTSVSVVGEHRDLGKITDSEWPDSCPSKYEKSVLSIICGNTHLYWGIHLGAEHDFQPNLFWRTPAITGDEIQAGNACALLERYLPTGGHELIFGGKDAPPNKAQAAKAAAERRVPTLGVYVVSTNPENESGIEFLFQDIPCRMHRLKASDFFSPGEGAYEGMGVDRLSNMKAASNLYQFPLLVLDGGTALTYTAADAKGKIIGGGIYPGFSCLCRSMHDYTGSLPLISQQEWNKTIQDAIANKKPVPIFADSTKGGMISAALQGMSSVVWGALTTLKAQVLADRATNGTDSTAVAAATDDNGDKEKENTMDDDERILTIAITGGDGNTIAQLLQPDLSSILESDKPPDALKGIDIQKHKNLCHYGVGHVLKEKAKAVQAIENEDDRVRSEIHGQRVAKKFKIRAEEKIFRGSIAAIAAGKALEDDWFYVRYDDGDTEHLSITGLYDALSLYRELGEDDPDAAEQPKIQKKMEEAKATADLLVATSSTVKTHSETPVAERKTAARKRSAGPTKSAPPPKVAKARSFSKKLDPQTYVNMRVAKFFGDDVFFGTITAFIPPPTSNDEILWHVLYDDEDSEDFDAKDLRKALNLYKENHMQDKKSRVTAVAEAGAEQEPEDDPAPAPAEEPEPMEDEPTGAAEPPPVAGPGPDVAVEPVAAEHRAAPVAGGAPPANDAP